MRGGSGASAPGKISSKRRHRLRAYLAGPDVFLPNAAAHAAAKVAICARHGIQGLPPLDDDEPRGWRGIFASCLRLMDAADIVIANLTPFRGASADSGTLVELGWFLGRGKPVFGYSNCAKLFAERSRGISESLPDPVPGLQLEGFGLADNLMVPGAVERGGGGGIVPPPDGRDRAFDALDIFELCVIRAGSTLPAR